MNDFTKEELSIIHLAIIRDMNKFDHILKTSPSMLKLRDKLETMLYNHCEHEPDGYCYDDNGDNAIGYQLHKYTQQRCKKHGDVNTVLKSGFNKGYTPPGLGLRYISIALYQAAISSMATRRES